MIVASLFLLLVVGSNAGGTALVDLSVDFETSSNLGNSAGADQITAVAKATPDIATALVLEHGKIVASYVREGFDPDTPLHIWSCTKSWTSLLIGVLVESGLLALDESLGEIFTDEAVWANVTDEEESFRKNVTIEELLTMSSGLIDPEAAGGFQDWTLTDGGNAGGADLQTSLSWPRVGTKGVFSYLSVSTILSYVIQERAGMSPREYLSMMVLPALGIDDSAIDWWQNEDGMEYAYHGLHLTAHQMAKFGQLYLQNGLASPNRSLVSAEWIEQSTSPQVEAVVPGDPSVPDGPTINASYGYLFWMSFDLDVGDLGVGEYYCAVGAYGQDICISPELDRVSVQQRDVLGDPMGSFVTTAIALDKSVSFTASEVDQPGDTNSAGEWRHPALSILIGSTILPLAALV